MKSIIFLLIYTAKFAPVLALLVVLIILAVRSRRIDLPSTALWTLWMIGFILCSSLALVSLFVTIMGIALIMVEFGALLLIPAVPSLLIFGICSVALWRCRPKDKLKLKRIAGVMTLVVIVTICAGVWLNESCSKTITFEILDSAECPIVGAIITIHRSSWAFGGLVSDRDYKLITDRSGQAVLKTWDPYELKAKVDSPSGAVTIVIKSNDRENQIELTHTWFISLIEKYPLHENEAVSFVPIKYPLHIRSYVMPEKTFIPNRLLEESHKSLLSDPERIFKLRRDLPFSLLLIKDDAELERLQLSDCPTFFSESCTLSEEYSFRIVDTLRTLDEAFDGIRKKINRNGAEATSDELELISSAETIFGLEHLQLPWKESAMRVLPLIDQKLAHWKEKEKAVDERKRLARERFYQRGR